MNLLRNIISIENKNSITTKIRQENFKVFKSIVSCFERRVKILDLGGTQEYWEMMEYTDPNIVDITLINLDDIQVSLPNFRAIKMDVLDLNILKFDCDIIFSHSLIEHINHEEFAELVLYFGKPYFIQTPNKHFPVEPHFMIPLFQYFPLWLKILCVRNFKKELESEVETIKLLDKKELEGLFPNSTISGAKLFMFIQSFIIYKL